MFSQFSTRYTSNPALKYAFFVTLPLVGIPILFLILVGLILGTLLYIVFSWIVTIVTFVRSILGLENANPSPHNTTQSQDPNQGRVNVRVMHHDD